MADPARQLDPDAPANDTAAAPEVLNVSDGLEIERRGRSWTTWTVDP